MPTEDIVDRNLIVSDEERRTGQLSPEHLRLGLMLLLCRGYVVLKRALPLELVEAVRSRFTVILDDCQRSAAAQSLLPAKDTLGEPWTSKDGTRYLVVESRFRIFPRLEGLMADPMLIANPFATAILEQTLGADFYCKSVGSDTCLKGSILQSPHRDINYYEDGVPQSTMVNIPLVHCGLHNGPLEVWPGGSHLWRGALFERFGLEPFIQDARNPPVEQFAEHMSTKKIDLHPGDLLLRDPGMWHRGTPNPTDEPRTMLTIGCFRQGYVYEYGDPHYNLSSQLFEQLPPAIKRMFQHAFPTRG